MSSTTNSGDMVPVGTPSTTTTTATRKHILTVTIGAWGHIIPLLELAKKLGQHHDVTFAISAIKIAEMRQRELIHDEAGDGVQFYPIPDGIEKDLEDVNDKEAMGRAFMAVATSFVQLMSSIPVATKGVTDEEPAVGKPAAPFAPVDVVIVDCFAGATMPLPIPYYLFVPASGKCLHYVLSFKEDTPTVADDTFMPFMRLPEKGQELHAVPAFEKMMILPIKQTVHLATGLIMNAPRAIEARNLVDMQQHPNIQGLTVHCVGPLLQDERHFTTKQKVTNWLAGKAESSVVYVSFGSVPFATPPPEQLAIIGEALLALGRPFIWSLKEQHYQHLPEELRSQIGGQFDEASKEGGKFLVIPWAPQKMILAHESVGVFVSHCGWNSTLEGLANGMPFVAWPILADQLLNALSIVELGVGVLIPDTGLQSRRTVAASEITDAVSEVVMQSKYHEVARLWKEKLRDVWTPSSGTSYGEFQDLVRVFSQ